mgnify:CR=1 FL=1
MDEPFNIYMLNEEGAAKIAGKPNEPHIHEFEELLIGVEGDLEHLIDFKSDVYKAPYVSFITRGKMHRVRPLITGGKCRIWVIRFSSDFIPGTSFRLYSQYHDVANIEMVDDANFKRMVMLCEMMDGEMKQENPAMSVVRDLLKALFTMVEVEREKHIDSPANFSSQNTTFRNFLTILEENFRRPDIGVEFYAEKLFMSSRNLNLVCQNIINMSVSELIETRRITESKNLLTYTDKTISEIGFEIGYNEKSCFTTVFKKNNGVTPSAFRQQMRSII